MLRGKLMAEADDSGSMLALLGGTIEDAEAIAEAAGVTVANDNAPGQVVLSGERGALEEAEEAAREYNVRARPLDVAGAFHSPRMEPAVAPFREALDEVELGDPRFPVYCGATAAPFTDVRARAGRGAHPPGPLARDLPRPARSGRRGLRRDRPRHRAVEDGPPDHQGDRQCVAHPSPRRHRPRRRHPPHRFACSASATTCPRQVVNNLPIAERLGIDEHWIEKRTGIRSRRHAMPHERLSDLATAAGQAARRGRGDRPGRARRRARRHHLGRRDHAQRGALRRHRARRRARPTRWTSAPPAPRS